MNFVSDVVARRRWFRRCRSAKSAWLPTRSRDSVSAGELDGVLRRADALGQFETVVPEIPDQLLDDGLLGVAGPLRAEEEEVDVGERRRIPAAVAADRDKCQVFQERGARGGADLLQGDLVGGDRKSTRLNSSHA